MTKEHSPPPLTQQQKMVSAASKVKTNHSHIHWIPYLLVVSSAEAKNLKHVDIYYLLNIPMAGRGNRNNVLFWPWAGGATPLSLNTVLSHPEFLNPLCVGQWLMGFLRQQRLRRAGDGARMVWRGRTRKNNYDQPNGHINMDTGRGRPGLDDTLILTPAFIFWAILWR